MQAVVKSVISGSKIIKVDLATKADSNKFPLNSKELSIHNIKPGSLVSAKVQRILDNGIELYFLSGYTGTVFIDHLDKGEPTKYKAGEKLNARIVSVDPPSQSITLSLLPHLVKFENISKTLLSEGITSGKVFEKATVMKVAFGDSYKIALTPQITGFLHKIHAVKKEKVNKSKDDLEVEDDEDLKKN